MSSLQPFFTPEAIEAESFAIIDREIGPARPFAGRAWEVARRLVHTTADFDILNHLYIDETAVTAGVAAIRRGVSIFTDTDMARCGMPLRRLNPFGITPLCLLYLPGVAERAAQAGSTRAKAAFELAADRLGGSIVAVGNAPTALLALTDYLQGGGEPPALVVAMPVGFVNAAESKALFVRYCEAAGEAAPACIAITGRKGGSPLAAATVNALAELALRESRA